MDVVTEAARTGATSPPQAARCPLCGSADVALQRTHRFPDVDFEYRYHACRRCTALFIHPLPTPELLASLYDRAYYGHAAEAASTADRNSFSERLGRLEQLSGGPGRLIDVGAGAGQFLRSARDRGWKTVGVEISRFGIDGARADGLEMIEGFFESAALPSGPFDVVHAWAVFEHFVDPLRAVRRAHELLRPGGIFVINTVNVGSLNARYYGPDWEYFQDFGHLVFPTEHSLRRMFDAEGFEVSAVYYGGNPIGINRLSATNNTRGVKSPALKRLLRGARDRVLGDPRLRRAAKQVVQWLRLGDAITVYARRR